MTPDSSRAAERTSMSVSLRTLISPVSGWVARSYEYVQNNRIFRPRSKYTGEKAPRRYVPINERN